MPTDIVIPELGESISEVQIAQWHKAKGERVEKDEPLVTLDSEKASVDLPAPTTGILTEVRRAEGDAVPVGEVIGQLTEVAEATEDGEGREKEEGGVGEEEAQGEPAGDEEGEETGKVEEGVSERSAGLKGEGKEASGSGRGRQEDRSKPEEGSTGEPRVMPTARQLLEENGLEATEVRATGPGGRLLKEDVLAHLESKKRRRRPRSTGKPTNPERPESESKTEDRPVEEADGPGVGGSGSAESQEGEEPARAKETEDEPAEVVRMSPLRRTVARRLVEAQRTMAILTTFNEVDMTAVKALREQFREPFEKRHGVRLGFMSFFVKAVVAALQEVPQLNAELRGTDLVLHHRYDIGVAIGSGKGLVVPTVRGADSLSYAQIEREIADLADRAEKNRLKPAELEGSTFTISNGGIYGSLLSTPIINPPQSGILGLHAIQDRPVARGGQVVICPMMYVALGYDHRLVDGREAVTFLRRVKEYIETPARVLLGV